MSADIRVSVIMPVYNCADKVGKAINSILKQTLIEIEVIIIDDCSSDHTQEVLQKYTERDSRITVIHMEKNSGPGAAKNKGIMAARGEYLSFCDADDWIEGDMLRAMYEASEKGKMDIILCGYSQDTLDQGKISVDTRKNIYMSSLVLNSTLEIIKEIPMIDAKKMFSFAVNKLYKRQLILDNKIFFSGKMFGEDYDLNIDCFPNAKSLCIVEPCYYHYVKSNSESLTEKYIPDFYNNIRERYIAMRSLLTYNQVFEGDVRGVAASVHIKHIIASLIRNCSKDTQYNFIKRYSETKKILSDSYTVEACKYARAYSRQSKVCNFVCSTKSVLINMFFARILYITQNYMKHIFEKVK